MVDEITLLVNRFLAWVFTKFNIERIRDPFIRWATEKVHDLVERNFNQDRLGESFVQHATFVFNQVIIRIRDGKVTKDEAEQIMEYLKRFAQVWAVYKEKRDRETAKEVITIARKMKTVFS